MVKEATKKKAVLSLAFVISLLPMVLNQYGGCKGVQEISGLINLCNPIGIASVLLFAGGLWAPFHKPAVNRILGSAGVIGVVISEVCNFFTWHIPTISGKLSLTLSLRLAYPQFYFGLAVSVAMAALYFWMDPVSQNP